MDLKKTGAYSSTNVKGSFKGKDMCFGSASSTILNSLKITSCLCALFELLNKRLGVLPTLHFYQSYIGPSCYLTKTNDKQI